MTKVYVYETTQGNAVLIKADAAHPSIIEVRAPDSDDNSDPGTVMELVVAARDLGYDVVHWRYDDEEMVLGPEPGCILRIEEDGAEYLNLDVPGDILERVVFADGS